VLTGPWMQDALAKTEEMTTYFSLVQFCLPLARRLRGLSVGAAI
jgi:hypothetical protein